MESSKETAAAPCESRCSTATGWVAVWDRGVPAESPIQTTRRKGDPGLGKRDRLPSWKVAWKEGNEEYIVPIGFARKVDAERAAETVRDAQLWGPTTIEVAEQLSEFGHRRFRELLMSQLAW